MKNYLQLGACGSLGSPPFDIRRAGEWLRDSSPGCET